MLFRLMLLFKKTPQSFNLSFQYVALQVVIADDPLHLNFHLFKSLIATLMMTCIQPQPQLLLIGVENFLLLLIKLIGVSLFEGIIFFLFKISSLSLLLLSPALNFMRIYFKRGEVITALFAFFLIFCRAVIRDVISSSFFYLLSFLLILLLIF